ncbi:galactose-1-phosphate uridylyltransferase [candidate division KSB1 bacterium]|nr:galactose-1-phosphate uridylyltransferase [candidate division KSB1 bacterium]
MPELRKDPLIDRWVIISTERSKRGSDWEEKVVHLPSRGFCPFCEGNESRTPPEITAIRDPGTHPDQPGWKIRVVPNKFPALKAEGDLKMHRQGIYEIMDGIGTHEVIIETPQHNTHLDELSVDHLLDLFKIFRDRIRILQKDLRFRYILIFKNSGYAAGASLEHSHSQIIATPIIPNQVLQEIAGFQKYYLNSKQCVLCDIIRQELTENKRIIISENKYIAFAPFASRFPFETWILPRKHQAYFENEMDDSLIALVRMIKYVLSRLAEKLYRPPFNLILYNLPRVEQQENIYHWRIEIIPKLTKVAGFEWGSGFYINPMSPEQAAEILTTNS